MMMIPRILQDRSHRCRRHVVVALLLVLAILPSAQAVLRGSKKEERYREIPLASAVSEDASYQRRRSLKAAVDGTGHAPKDLPKEEDDGDSESTPSHRLVVTYRNAQGHQNALDRAKSVLQDRDDDDVVVMTCVGDDCMDQMHQDPMIASVEIDHKVEAAGMMWPLLGRRLDEYMPWGIVETQLDQVDVGPAANETLVCIVDTGIAIGHPDFNHDYINGTDNVVKLENGDTVVWKWNEDFAGHGTHVAGTIAAFSGNGIGVYGAGNFRLHITRGLGDDGYGYESDIRRAVTQCVEAGADVINMSLGGSGISNSLYDYYRYVVEELGVMIVAAAGNYGTNQLFYPAGHPSVISVAAAYPSGVFTEFSNWGKQTELTGPGHAILSTTIGPSAVQTNTHGYPSYPVRDTPGGAATGILVNCGTGDHACEGARDGICYMMRDNKKVKDMIKNCIKSGGIGAIIFEEEEATDDKAWKCNKDCTIPAVQVSFPVAQELEKKFATEVIMGDTDSDGVEYTYEFFRGTSMASPHVAAAAAMVKSYYPECSNQQIRYALAASALDLPTEEGNRSLPPWLRHNRRGCDQDHGYGMVKAVDALTWMEDKNCTEWTIQTEMQGGCTILDD